jgi:hypothetical protein
MYPFYIPPELYEALGPAAVVVPLPHPRKSKRTSPTPNTPFPEDIYWSGAPPAPLPAAAAPPPPPTASAPPPAVIAPPRPGEAKPPSRLRAMLPDLAVAAAAVAQRLAQPRQVGESGMMAATQALVHGYNTLAQLQWMRYAQQMAQRQQQLQEMKTLADIARTQEEARKTQAEARKIHEEADVVKPKFEIDKRRVEAFEKQVEGNLQLGRDRLALEIDKLAEQVSVEQEKLRQRDRELDLEEKRVGIMGRDVASQEAYRKAQVGLQAKRLELERQRNAILEKRLQLEVLKAAKEGKSPKELEADLIKEAFRNMPPEADEKDFLWVLYLARRAAAAYARSEYGQPVSSPPNEKGARLVQPSSSEYVRAIETSNGEVYELRRDGQWFRTR